MNVFLSGKVDSTWEKYQLYQAPLEYKDRPTKYKAIIYKGHLVAILGANYKLLPNEEAIKLANQIAENVGAVPFKANNLFRDNVFFNKHRTRVYVKYILPDEVYDINGRDTCRLGFSITNSIDGGLAFGVTGFTFREMCSNGVILGYKALTRFYRKHTARFMIDSDKILVVVSDVLEQTRKVLRNYAKMVTIELNEEIAEQIAKSTLPRKLLPDYIETERDKLIRFDASKTLWDVYNDLTANIWHNVKTDIDTKKNQFDILHQIIKVI